MRAIRIEKKRLLYKGWFGANNLTAKVSLNDFRIAVKYIWGDEDLYYCYLPHPDEEDLCLALIISESDLIKRLTNSSRLHNIYTSRGVGLMDIVNAEMPDKLNVLCDYFDVFDFFELDEDSTCAINKNDIRLGNSIPKNATKVLQLSDLL